MGRAGSILRMGRAGYSGWVAPDIIIIIIIIIIIPDGFGTLNDNPGDDPGDNPRDIPRSRDLGLSLETNIGSLGLETAPGLSPGGVCGAG